MKHKISEIVAKTGVTFGRYPWVLSMAMVAALSACAVVEISDFQTTYPALKLGFAAALGISLMFAAKIYSQRSGQRFWPEVVALALLAAFYLVLPADRKDFTDRYVFVIFPSFVLAHLLVAFVAFLSKNRQLNFWQFNKNLFLNIVLAGLFTAVLVGGVLLAIVAVDKLFDAEFNNKIYSETFFFISIFGSCLIFLLFVKDGLPTAENDASYPQNLKFFTQFVLVPLLLVYLVILYLYFAKILFRWELPRGWVSYLVLAYSVAGILALLLVFPLKNDGTKSWVRVFSKAFYYSLLPLLAMLFTAIFTRILEYGYTEPRYYVALLAYWLGAVVVYFIFFKNPSIKFIPIALFAVGIIGLSAPYINAFAVSKRSQEKELMLVLNKEKVLEKGRINFNKRINNTAANEISDKFRFLAERDDDAFLQGLLPDKLRPEISKVLLRKNGWEVYQTVRNSFTDTAHPKETALDQSVTIVSEQTFSDVAGFDYVAGIIPEEVSHIKIGNDEISLINRPDSRTQTLILKTADGRQQSYDLAPAFAKLAERQGFRTNIVRVPQIAQSFSLGSYDFKLTANKMYYRKNDADQSIWLSGITLLIRKK